MARRWWLIAGWLSLTMPGTAMAAPEKCRIFYYHDKQVEAAFGESGYEFEGFDTLCRFLKQRNLRVVIAGDSGVLSNRSYSWAYAKVADRRTFVESSGSTFSTILNVEASSPTAQKGLRRAANSALQIMAENPRHLADLAEQVVAETARLRAVLAVPAPAPAPGGG